jgi:hypothetical protein
MTLFRAGGPINDESDPGLIRVPLLSVPLHQRIIEKLVKDGDGETRRVAQLQRESLAVTAKTSDDALDLVCFDVLTVAETASSGECLTLLFGSRLQSNTQSSNLPG